MICLPPFVDLPCLLSWVMLRSWSDIHYCCTPEGARKELTAPNCQGSQIEKRDDVLLGWRKEADRQDMIPPLNDALSAL